MKPLSIAGALVLSLVSACGGSGTTAKNGQEAVGPNTANAAQPAYSASGTVTAIAGDRVTISHGPVEGLGWPAMTMTFRAAGPAMLPGVSVGDRVAFQFRQNGSDYPLTALNKTP
jgi:Cu(I)/Ag(I) efflux system membrane fusion protein